jgi:superoxide dismutase, Fe-Mn family
MSADNKSLINRTYPFELLPLQYSENAFTTGFLTPEIFSYHRNKHHQGYINKLNGILSLDENENLRKMNLEDLIKYSRINQKTAIFNNAAQIWNHDFFWLCLSPHDQEKHKKTLWTLILNQYESWENFIKIFVEISINHFASGWSWLVIADGKLKIMTTINAELPLNDENSVLPIFTCDLWEHSYYLAFKNDRSKYVETMLRNFLNWENLEINYESRINLIPVHQKI